LFAVFSLVNAFTPAGAERQYPDTVRGGLLSVAGWSVHRRQPQADSATEPPLAMSARSLDESRRREVFYEKDRSFDIVIG
jgi:hypothetical protein